MKQVSFPIFGLMPVSILLRILPVNVTHNQLTQLRSVSGYTTTFCLAFVAILSIIDSSEVGCDTHTLRSGNHKSCIANNVTSNSFLLGSIKCVPLWS